MRFFKKLTFQVVFLHQFGEDIKIYENFIARRGLVAEPPAAGECLGSFPKFSP